jgi:RNA polymerase sigma-70 factor (ECF subfamily)
MERARRFDRQALAEIYDRYSPGLFRYAMHLLGQADLAEECVAETFSRFLQALKAGKGPGEYLQAYLFRVARNWISDLFRRERPSEELQEERWSDPTQDPVVTAELGFRRRRLRQALRQLTPDQQQVILLKFGEGWENEAIARSLHKPVGAVKSLQHRALIRLQKILEEPE